GPRLHRRDAARAHLGRFHLPRPHDRRRPHQAPPREAGVRRQAPRVPVHRTRGRLSLPRYGPRLRLNTLRNRLVALITLITAAAIGFVYLYVVPQLESSLTAEKLRRLERLATEQAPQLSRALESGVSQQQIQEQVRTTAQS